MHLRPDGRWTITTDVRNGDVKHHVHDVPDGPMDGHEECCLCTRNYRCAEFTAENVWEHGWQREQVSATLRAQVEMAAKDLVSVVNDLGRSRRKWPLHMRVSGHDRRLNAALDRLEPLLRGPWDF